MDRSDIEARIRNFDFHFLKYLSSETKDLSNKVITLSCLIILLNFQIVEIKKVDIGGVGINIQKDLVNVLLFLINLYFFLQFKNSIRIDLLMLKIPEDHKDICDLISNHYAEQTNKMDLLKEEYERAQRDGDFSSNTGKKLKDARIKIEDELPNSYNDWIISSKKSLVYRKYNLWLNHVFPTMCFIVSSFSQLMFLKSLFDEV